MTIRTIVAGAVFGATSAFSIANAQIAAVENPPVATMEAALEGSGIDVRNLVAERGNTQQYGTFSNGTATININEGVFISTGGGSNFAAAATTQSDIQNLANTPDPDLTGDRTTATNDTVALSMTVTPTRDTIRARIVFASEEYPEYVCSQFNDAFGLYVTGPGIATQNIAVIPGTMQDVSINTINNGLNNDGVDCPGEGPNNSNLYNDNAAGANFIFDGYTDALNVQLDGVTPGQDYTFKMVTADAIDQFFDSAVFIDFLESRWANTADVSLQLAPSTGSPIVGQNFTITATLNNAGPDPIPFLKVADLLPDGLTFVSASGDGTYDETLDEWETTGPLAAGADFTLTLTVSAPSVATFATDAEVIEQWSDDVDSTPNDGTGDDFASLSVTAVQLDRSDAPVTGTSYGEATHVITAGIQLGAAIDADVASIANADASGDGADDDGVTIPTLTQGASATISVDVQQVAGNDGYLQGWIDWNGDGDFDDPAEQVATDLQSADTGASTISVPVTVPAIATTTPTFARFRWSTTQALDSTTAASDGEVEDYQVTIDAADGGSPVLPPVCTTGQRATLDWSSATWPQGSLSNSFAVNNASITVDILDPQNALNGTPNGPTPVNAAFYQGGLASIDNTLIFEANDADLANDDVTIRYAFSRPVEEVRVSLFDLDFSDLGPRIERATITAYIGATPVPVTLQGGSAILISGNSAFGIAESDPVGGASGDGTVQIGVTQPIDRLEISYGHGAGTDRTSNPGNPGFGLHDLSFCAQVDRADAPISYGDADHVFVPGRLLGTRNDVDTGSILSADASGDGADDDGVTLPVLTQGLASNIEIDVTGTGVLQAWIDFDGDGTFGAGEQIASDVQDGGTGDSDNTADGTITLSVTAPVNGFYGTSFARFRWSSDTGLGATGTASDGEVEDYQVKIAEIAALSFTPDNTRTVSAGSSVSYAHVLFVPEALAGGTLAFTQTSDQGLIWTVWQDVDGSGDLSAADTEWVNGSAIPATGSTGFLFKALVPNDVPDGWRDLSSFTATVTLGGQTRSDGVTDITDVTGLNAGSLRAYKLMAIDLDCDGALGDESAADATFEVQKAAQPGQCIVYRIGFVNDGVADVSAVNVRDYVPAWTGYRAGSAAYETTPPGLSEGTLSAPAGGTRGPLAFPYTGTLSPGGEGTVTYEVQISE